MGSDSNGIINQLMNQRGRNARNVTPFDVAFGFFIRCWNNRQSRGRGRGNVGDTQTQLIQRNNQRSNRYGRRCCCCCCWRRPKRLVMMTSSSFQCRSKLKSITSTARVAMRERERQRPRREPEGGTGAICDLNTSTNRSIEGWIFSLSSAVNRPHVTNTRPIEIIFKRI